MLLLLEPAGRTLLLLEPPSAIPGAAASVADFLDSPNKRPTSGIRLYIDSLGLSDSLLSLSLTPETVRWQNPLFRPHPSPFLRTLTNGKQLPTASEYIPGSDSIESVYASEKSSSSRDEWWDSLDLGSMNDSSLSSSSWIVSSFGAALLKRRSLSC